MNHGSEHDMQSGQGTTTYGHQKERNWRSRAVVRAVAVGLLLGVAAMIVSGVRLFGHVAKGAQAARLASSYERRIVGADITMFVIGDSTAFGTGASQPEYSSTGRLGATFPTVEIINFGVNGANLVDVADRVERRANAGVKADIVLLQVGGNDVLSFTPHEDMRHELIRVADATQRITNRAFILHGGDPAAVPITPLWMRPLLRHKAWQTRELYLDVLSSYDMTYFDLIRDTRFGWSQSLRPFGSDVRKR